MKLLMTLPNNKASDAAGDTRYASSTPLRSSRAQDWFNATTVENKNATQNSPPARRRDSSDVGSNAKLKITTTSTAKNSMALNTSRDRHSRRRSLARLAAMSRSREFVMRPPALTKSARRVRRLRGLEIRPPFPPGGRVDA